MIQCQEKNDVDPICPHCESVLKTLWVREMTGWLGRRYLYFCAECRKVLGVSHRKGFWMG